MNNTLFLFTAIYALSLSPVAWLALAVFAAHMFLSPYREKDVFIYSLVSLIMVIFWPAFIGPLYSELTHTQPYGDNK